MKGSKDDTENIDQDLNFFLSILFDMGIDQAAYVARLEESKTQVSVTNIFQRDMKLFHRDFYMNQMKDPPNKDPLEIYSSIVHGYTTREPTHLSKNPTTVSAPTTIVSQSHPAAEIYISSAQEDYIIDQLI